jgi:molybdopterin-synthase adenylyltransferase
MAHELRREMTTDRLFDRINGLFDVQSFKDVNVLIAGCGSGGANVALQLAMSGIRNFTLLDKDTLEPENVIRHICGRRYIGQKKVSAVADALLDRNPNINIKQIDADLMLFEGLDLLIADSDLVVLATDNEPSRYRLNELCVARAVPFVVGRVFTRGIGGEVFSYRPNEGGCLACLESFLQRTTYREGIREVDLVSDEERDKIYGLEVAEIKDSPGLIVDISFITSFHTRFALDAISRGLPTPPKFLTAIQENYLVWGNRPIHPFSKHFQLQRITLAPQEQCLVCSQRKVASV